MRRLLLVSALLLASPAYAAADKPVIAPAPAWVTPTPFPKDVAASGAAPIRLLLQDEQVHFADGATTKYDETVFRIQTPQGLSAGSISVPWDPDTSVLTVHKLQIHRGDAIIDVLASGQTFTVVRREQNLENAVLDGVLTANIQPEGLQVGDVIDFAASVMRKDPAMKGHYESVSGGWGVLPVSAVRMRADWPGDRDVQVRERGALPKLVRTSKNGVEAVSLTADKVDPVVAPSGAPGRYNQARLVELSDFADWGAVSALLAPLYAKAEILAPDAKLKAEIAKIAASSSDPKKRADAALKLVQDRVRYVFIGTNDGGLVPADAETTWDRRFGDCKGKTVLLLAVLHGLGIAAEPAAVNMGGFDGLDQHLPMVEWFNHVIVRATIGGRVYWLDGTRTGDIDIDAIRTPPFGWALPLQSSGATLVKLVQQPLDRPDTETTLRLDASAGLSLPAPAHAEIVFRGDSGTNLHAQLSGLAGDALTEALRKYWQSSYSFITVKTATASYDPVAHEEKLVMDGTAKMDWGRRQYETDGTLLGYKADFSRADGPDRDAPYSVDFPSYSRTTETVVLPHGGDGFTFFNGDPVDQTIAGVHYRRTATIADGVATVTASTRSIAKEFPASEAPAAQTALRALSENDVYINEPQDYVDTDAELDALMKTTPTTADGFVHRGNSLLDAGRLDAALGDFDSALALDPKNILALTGRGFIHTVRKQWTLARQDLKAAAAIDPDSPALAKARAGLAAIAGDPAGAIPILDKEIAEDPGNSDKLMARGLLYLQSGDNQKAIDDAQRIIASGQNLAVAYLIRSRAYRALGNTKEALADADRAIATGEHRPEAYLLRANLLRAQGDEAGALQQAAALIAADPDDADAQVTAGAIYASYHKDGKAMAAFSRAIAIEPSASAYLTRLRYRPKSDLAGRKADADAALKLAPDLPDAILAEAEIDRTRGDFADAIAAISRGLVTQPDNPDLLAGRGMNYALSGDPARAEQDYAAARKAATSPQLNNLCWIKATSNVSLSSALADCDAALAKAPDNPAYLDSRAFVLLRQGHYAEAIAAYDKALAGQPNQPSSLYGRAVAEARLGQSAKAEADRAAALKREPSVEEDFTDYGVVFANSDAGHAAPATASK
jgi:tetratricopeptide (TPR) repeat protein